MTSITFNFSDGLAQIGLDYVPLDGSNTTVIFTAGSTHYLRVRANRDLDNEDAEHFYLDITNISNGKINGETTAKRRIDIINKIAPTITHKTVGIKEGTTKAIYAQLSEEIDVMSVVTANSSEASATELLDYQTINTTLTFSPGSLLSTAFFNVNAKLDAISEFSEYYYVHYYFQSNPTEPWMQMGDGRVFIVENPKIKLEFKTDTAYLLSGDDDFDSQHDSFDFDGGGDGSEGSRRYEPFEITVEGDTEELDVNQTKIQFSYEEASSDRDVFINEGKSQSFRVWKKAFNESRYTSTDILHTGQSYSLAELNIALFEAKTLYFEAVTASNDQNTSLKVELIVPASTSSVSSFMDGPNDQKIAIDAINVRQFPKGFDPNSSDGALSVELVRVFNELYNSDQDDKLTKYLIDQHGLTVIVTDSWPTSWGSHISTSALENTSLIDWTVVIDKSELLDKGPLWGATEIRRLTLAQIGLSDSQNFVKTLSVNPNDLVDYFYRGRVDHMAAAASVWQSKFEFWSTAAMSVAEFAIGFAPGGEVGLIAANLATGEYKGKTNKLAIDTALAFMPAAFSKATQIGGGQLLDAAQEFIGFIWRKSDGRWTQVQSDGLGFAPNLLNEKNLPIPNTVKLLDDYLSEWCFVGNTPVATCHGSIPIESIAIGTKVKTYDFTTESWGCNAVQIVHKNQYTGPLYKVITADSTIEVTSNHPFWVIAGNCLDARPWPEQLSTDSDDHPHSQGRWVDSHQLEVGDRLLALDGRMILITEIEVSMVDGIDVYNLAVGESHTFAVGELGILVHNDSYCQVYRQALGWTPTELIAKQEAVANAWQATLGITSVILTHGHHIVHKVGAYKAGSYGEIDMTASQNRLVALGIDLLDDPATAKAAADAGKTLYNLCIAPLKYVHSFEYARHLRQLLETAANNAQGKALLTEIKVALENGQKLDSLLRSKNLVPRPRP